MAQSTPEEPSDPPAPARPPRGPFFQVRVAILLAILAGVLLYAWRDVRSRSLRNDWTRTLDVAIVVSIAEASPSLTAALERRIDALEDRLAEEHARHRGAGPRPFDLHLAIVEAPATAAPQLPEGDDLWSAARWSWDLRSFTAALDAAAGIDDRRWDTRLYVIAREPADEHRKAVEGVGEQGGRVGLVEVELDEAMVDFALFVVTHELFHTLGATDKYDDLGEPRAPEGLADPHRDPLYPQDGAEVMARHRAVAPGRSAPPESLGELTVGEATAREIGWRAP